MIFLSMFILGIVCIEVWPSELPMWALIVALLMAFIYVVPIGMIFAISRCVVSLPLYLSLIRISRLPNPV